MTPSVSKLVGARPKAGRGWHRLSLTLAIGLIVLTGCGGATTTTINRTVTVTPQSAAPTAAQVREKAAAEAATKQEEAARSRREGREAAASKRAEEHKEQEEKAHEAAEQHRTVPNVVKVRLDVAEEEIESAGLQYKVVGGGLFGVIVKSNWTVCEMKPSPGTHIGSGATVRLIVARSCG